MSTNTFPTRIQFIHYLNVIVPFSIFNVHITLATALISTELAKVISLSIQTDFHGRRKS